MYVIQRLAWIVALGAVCINDSDFGEQSGREPQFESRSCSEHYGNLMALGRLSNASCEDSEFLYVPALVHEDSFPSVDPTYIIPTASPTTLPPATATSTIVAHTPTSTIEIPSWTPFPTAKRFPIVTSTPVYSPGVDYGIYARCTVVERLDKTGNGEVDMITVRKYNEFSEIGKEEIDSDADGIVDTTKTYSYSSTGNLLKREDDSNADGITDSLSELEYSEDSLLSAIYYDQGNDGVIDRTTEFAYNESGQVVLETIRSRDGTDELKSVYNTDGNLIRSSIQRSRFGGRITAINFEWEDGLMVRTYSKAPEDGLEDRSREYEYLDRFLVSTASLGTGSRFYYDDGKLIRFERFIGGDIEDVTEFKYDDRGLLSERTYDHFVGPLNRYSYEVECGN